FSLSAMLSRRWPCAVCCGRDDELLVAFEVFLLLVIDLSCEVWADGVDELVCAMAAGAPAKIRAATAAATRKRPVMAFSPAVGRGVRRRPDEHDRLPHRMPAGLRRHREKTVTSGTPVSALSGLRFKRPDAWPRG